MVEFQRDPFVVSRPLAEGYILIPLRRSDGHLEDNILRLPDVAARIWELLEVPMTLEGLLARLEEEYAVEPSRLRADVEAFLQRLVELRALNRGSLQPTSPGNTG